MSVPVQRLPLTSDAAQVFAQGFVAFLQKHTIVLGKACCLSRVDKNRIRKYFTFVRNEGSSTFSVASAE